MLTNYFHISRKAACDIPFGTGESEAVGKISPKRLPEGFSFLLGDKALFGIKALELFIRFGDVCIILALSAPTTAAATTLRQRNVRGNDFLT